MECNESVRTSGFKEMKETEKSNGKKKKNQTNKNSYEKNRKNGTQLTQIAVQGQIVFARFG